MKPMKIKQIVLDSRDIKALAAFYEKLLGWEKIYEAEDFVGLSLPSGGPYLCIQREMEYTPVDWPQSGAGVHFDILVEKDAMQETVEYAISCGAKKAEEQYSENWTVMLDPQGHPFCFDT